MAVANRAPAKAGVRHFIYAPDGRAAESIAATLERGGWESLVRTDNDVWLVIAWCHRVLAAPLDEESRMHLRSVAAQHGGEYDGWEAATA